MNMPGYLFMCVIVSLFLGLVISAEEIFKDRKILRREKFLNLSRFSYLDAKISVLIIISAIQTITFILIGNYVLEIRGMEWRFFLILFTAACWANMVGLNISAGFNSVVTIYVLVPLILVPQLLFSGVVIDFTNMNNRVRTEKYVPVIGDLIASRWAYEALMVTQFKDNRFEKKFFKYETEIENASFQRSFVIPELRKLSGECLQNIENKQNYEQTNRYFNVLKNELHKIKQITGLDDRHIRKHLHLETYTEDVKKDIGQYLDMAEYYFLTAYRKATKEKDRKFEELKNELGGIDQFVKFKQTFHNKKIASIILNENEILEYQISKDEIIRLKDAIFTYPDSKFGRAQFYAPVKKLGPLSIDTYWFNIIRLWLSVFLLYVILYLDLLRKLIGYIENLRLRRFNQRRFIRILKQYQLR
jgi:ABC transport system ATP-binding/permease protein